MKAMLLNAMLVGSGGFVGALLRFGVNNVAQRHSAFPFGTLTVNMLGCLAIGVFVGLMDTREFASPEFRLFILVGLLGGFTTYSTFGLETFALLRDAEYAKAFTIVAVHVVLGLALVWAGYVAASR